MTRQVRIGPELNQFFVGRFTLDCRELANSAPARSVGGPAKRPSSMPKSSVPVLSTAELSDHDGDAVETVTVDRRRRGHQKVPPRSRLWGFVRSNDGGIDEAGGKRLVEMLSGEQLPRIC